MIIDDLRVGEIYHDIILGPIVLTEFSRNLLPNIFSGKQLGKFELLMGSREYTLYESRLESEYFRLATDKEIENCIFNEMTRGKLSSELSISFDNDGVYLYDDYNHICLNRQELIRLINTIDKEINL